MDKNKCTCGRGAKDHCADCSSETAEEGKCVDCGSDNRAFKCDGCDDAMENCACPPVEE